MVAAGSRLSVRAGPALGAAAAAGAGPFAGYLAGGGGPSPAAALGTATALGLAAGAWWLGARLAGRAGLARRAAAAAGAIPLYPWLAAWPLLLVALADPLARTQLLASRTLVALYLLAWLAAGVAGLALWLRVAVAPQPGVGGPPEPLKAGAWWVAVPLLAFAATSYWNGAVLDPLQFRGFPDYVTQTHGARRLLAGALPYDPGIRVWTDVNLPPITLLVLFAPFTAFSELGGKLAYFALNHAAFFAGVGVLLLAARPPRGEARTAWTSVVLAVALGFEPWHDSLRLGQQNGVVLFFLALSAAALLARRDALAGVALAAALIGKPSSALLGLYFLFAGRFRAAAAAAVAGLGAFALTLPWAGVENWRFYLVEKAPLILAGTPQQSNVALLALHARLFLSTEALGSFDAMPPLPAAQVLTRVAQALGALALWRVVRRDRPRDDRLGVHLEFGIALALSLSLVGHAWQSYVTWLIVAFVPLADARTWSSVAPAARRWIAGLVISSYAALAFDDVALYKVIGPTSPAAAVFASLPNVALLVVAFALALLLAAHNRTLRRG